MNWSMLKSLVVHWKYVDLRAWYDWAQPEWVIARRLRNVPR